MSRQHLPNLMKHPVISRATFALPNYDSMPSSLHKKLFLLFSILFLTTVTFGQTTLQGFVRSEKEGPVQGASVSIENTLDGTTTDSTGFFRLVTSEQGEHNLLVTAIGYFELIQSVNLDRPSSGLNILLQTSSTTLESVTISAGTFGSSQGSQKTVLNPIDVVTTAGAMADPVAALQSIPGVQRNGSQTGLMVRGGDASEASVVVDGLTVQNPFFSDVPGVAARSRFGIFQFKGLAFSSGGYSARYGQAMSSILELNTLDLPEESTVNLGINFAGLYASGSKLFHKDNMGIEASASYTNLSPFYKLANTNFDFYDVPKGGNFSLKYGWLNNKGGLLKFQANYSFNKTGIHIPNPFVAGEDMNYGISNQNAGTMLTYRQTFKDKIKWFIGAGYSFNNDDAAWGTFPYNNKDQRAQIRNEFTWYAAGKFHMIFGGEWQYFTIGQTFDTIKTSIQETQAAVYAEGEWTPVRWLALRPGIRYENSALLKTNTLAPRFSASVRAGKNGQVSVATGLFYQSPDRNYLLQGYRPEQQQAVHYIANYLWAKNDRTIRIEGYYKQYQELVLEHFNIAYDPNNYRRSLAAVDNGGHGYAGGIELFWNDKKTVKNLEYWLSYSYIDTRRLYKNFPVAATPDFISDHNLSLVTKYWVEDWNTMLSATYAYANGKPYYNPNNPDFLGDRTPDYHNLSIQVSYLRAIGKWFAVFYLSVDNVTNQKNIFGYRYSADGNQRYAIEPAMYRTVFFGVNLSLTKFDKDEL